MIIQKLKASEASRIWQKNTTHSSNIWRSHTPALCIFTSKIT